MIITKEVEIRWNPMNKQWYIGKGYEFTKWKDGFAVKVEDLPRGSNVRISYQCERCGKVIRTRYYYYNKYIDHLCNPCAVATKSPGKQRLSFNTVKSLFESREYTLLSTKYQNNESKLRYQCPKHGEQSIAYGDLQQGRGCPRCANEAITGKDSHRWRGGITELSNHLRQSLQPWKSQQLQRTHYTCELTGFHGDLNVHHVTSFAAIRDLTLEQLGLPVYETIGEYGDDLQLLTDTFLENNERLANPVVMLESVHQEFHSFCGGYSEDTTMEQLQQFKESLKSRKASLLYPA